MSLGTFTSASPPGAGRDIEAWIDFDSSARVVANQAFASPPIMYQMTRNAGQQAATVGPQNAAFSSAQLNNMRLGIYRGRVAWRFPNTNGAAPILTCQYPTAMRQYQKPPFNITSDGPFVWRYVLVCAAGPCTAQATPFDNGIIFENTTTQSNGIFGTGSPISGYGVYWGPDGRLHWASHRTLTNSFPDEDIIIAPADQDWHSIEFHITGASQQADAQVAVIYDGISLVSRNWAAGTVLPDYSSDANWLNQICTFGNGSLGFPTFLYLSEFRVMAGPTLSSLF
jgi:hypothetical protein